MSIDTHKGNTPAWVGFFLIVQVAFLWVIIWALDARIERLQKEVREDAIRRLEWEFIERDHAAHETEATP